MRDYWPSRVLRTDGRARLYITSSLGNWKTFVRLSLTSVFCLSLSLPYTCTTAVRSVSHRRIIAPLAQRQTLTRNPSNRRKLAAQQPTSPPSCHRLTSQRLATVRSTTNRRPLFSINPRRCGVFIPKTTKLAGPNVFRFSYSRPLLGPKRVVCGGDTRPP